MLWNLETSCKTDGADDKQNRVKPYPAGPAQGGGERDQLHGVELVHTALPFTYPAESRRVSAWPGTRRRPPCLRAWREPVQYAWRYRLSRPGRWAAARRRGSATLLPPGPADRRPAVSR